MAKRRANGEGGIRKRKDGRREGRYTAGRELEKALEEATRQGTPKPGQYTVGQWLEMWFADYARSRVRPSSCQTCRGYLDTHITPHIGHIPLDRLTTLGLQKLYKQLLAGGRVSGSNLKSNPRGWAPRQCVTSTR